MGIVVTTSHRPSRRTRTFAKELANALAAVRITRGKSSLEEFLKLSSEAGHSRVIVVDTFYGNPSRLRIYGTAGPSFIGQILLRGVRLLRENPTAVRFNPRGVVLVRAGYKEEALLSEMFNLDTVASISAIPRGYGMVVFEGGKAPRLRFLHPETLKDYGPILKVRGILQGA